MDNGFVERQAIDVCDLMIGHGGEKILLIFLLWRWNRMLKGIRMDRMDRWLGMRGTLIFLD